MMEGVSIVCPYCGKKAEYSSTSAFLCGGHDFGAVFVCVPCDARVGADKRLELPLGTLANSELRAWRVRAHNVFDRRWLDGQCTRTQAYKWLAEVLGVPIELAHIELCDVEMCKRVIHACTLLA